MIANVSWGSDFGGLTDYLIEHRDHEVLGLRGVSSIDRAADEMHLVAQTSERVLKPVLHVSFSAAVEDGVLPAKTWIELADEADQEFGLADHQRVVVRHREKGYDHIHVFWCTISEATGQTPPKQWFRTRGAPQPEMDQRALDEEQRGALPEGTCVRGAFSRFALSRLMSITRAFEVTHELRRLRDRKAVAAARRAGEPRPSRPVDRHREERTGRLPLSASAEVIRASLDLPTWPDARAALNALGFDFEPVIRSRKSGTDEYRGVVIFDLADPGNRAAASSFDLPDRRFGMHQIEKRHEDAALTLEQWWPTRGEHAPAVLRQTSDRQREREEYERLVEDHRRSEARRAGERSRLTRRHLDERKRLRAKLMRLRRLRATRFAPSERRRFYANFSRTTRARIWAAMERRQAEERALLRRRGMPTWTAFVADRKSSQGGRLAKQLAVPTAMPIGSVDRPSPRERPLAAIPVGEHNIEVEEDEIDLNELVRRQRDKHGR